MRNSLSLLGLLGATTLLASCGTDADDPTAVGQFIAEGSNILDGMQWELNRPIRLSFNHQIDPQSINFGSIRIRALNGNSTTQPVTGTFEIDQVNL